MNDSNATLIGRNIAREALAPAMINTYGSISAAIDAHRSRVRGTSTAEKAFDAEVERLMADKASTVRLEAVADANALLNDVGLPNVHALASTLKALTAAYRTADPFCRMSKTYNDAVRIVDSLTGLTGGNL